MTPRTLPHFFAIAMLAAIFAHPAISEPSLSYPESCVADGFETLTECADAYIKRRSQEINRRFEAAKDAARQEPHEPALSDWCAAVGITDPDECLKAETELFKIEPGKLEGELFGECPPMEPVDEGSMRDSTRSLIESLEKQRQEIETARESVQSATDSVEDLNQKLKDLNRKLIIFIRRREGVDI